MYTKNCSLRCDHITQQWPPGSHQDQANPKAGYTYVFYSFKTTWRYSPDWESRIWLHIQVIRWLAVWPQQLPLCMQRPMMQPGCSPRHRETLCRAMCPSITLHHHICTRAESASGKASGWVDRSHGLAQPSLAFSQDFKTSLCIQAVQVFISCREGRLFTSLAEELSKSSNPWDAWETEISVNAAGSPSNFTPLKGLSERAEPFLMEIAKWSSVRVS